MNRFIAFAISVLLPCTVFPFHYFKTIDGKRFFGNIERETDTYFMVELEGEHRVIRIEKADLLLMEHEELGLEVYRPDLLRPVDISTAKSPFYAAGNKIYVPMNSTKIAQRSGAGTLKMLLVKDISWNIVDTEEEAHYIMKYVFDDSGRDSAYLIVEDRDGNQIYKSGKVSARDWSPWDAGEESAEDLYKKMTKQIKKGKLQ